MGSCSISWLVLRYSLLGVLVVRDEPVEVRPPALLSGEEGLGSTVFDRLDEAVEGQPAANPGRELLLSGTGKLFYRR